jgi:hypothetical protein
MLKCKRKTENFTFRAYFSVSDLQMAPPSGLLFHNWAGLSGAAFIAQAKPAHNI